MLVLLVAACSDGGDGDRSSGDIATEETGSAIAGADTDEAGSGDASRGEMTEEAAPQSADDGSAPSTSPVALTPADLGRSIVYTATVELQADDVAAAGAEARQAVAALGGVVFGQESTTDPQPRTVLVFKVGPDQFDAALDALSGLGEVVRRDVSADDVTARVVDLESQISSSEASVERLRALLADAPSVEAIAALENQLLQRETVLEQLRGQLRTLQDQVALSTITLTITQPAALPELAVAVTALAGADGSRCPGEDELTVDEGDDLVVCVSIENTGNVPVTELEVRDHALRIDPEDVTFVDFAADETLAPGEGVVAWAVVEADPDATPSPDVTAFPVDDSGTRLRVAVATTTTPVALTVAEDTSLPGFGDAVGAGAGALSVLLGILIVAVGLAVPFLLLAAPVVAVVLWWRRRNSDDAPPAPAAS